MQLVLDIFTVICLGFGCLFALTGAVGILRMPDFFSRLHPAGKADTLGIAMITLGLLAETLKYEYGYLVAAKLVLIAMFVWITAPVATHAITKSAHLSGLKPWENGGKRND